MASAIKQVGKTKSARIDIVDFWRFFAAIMIVFRHISIVGGPKVESHFFVEFFFMLTGYFIFKHFQKREYLRQSVEKKCLNALKYTWQRFKQLLPFTIPIVVICSLAFAYQFYSHSHYLPYTLKIIRNIFIEPFMLPGQISPLGGRLITPIWYLAVMVFFMPIVSYIAQSKRKNTFILIMIPISWLFIASATDIHGHFPVSHPVSALRGLIPMLMGGLLFYAVEQLSKAKIQKSRMVLMTISEFALYFLMAYLAFRAYKPSGVLIVLAFFAILITLSGHSLTSKIRCKFFNFLGGVSLPLFMWHFGIIRLVKQYQWMGMTRRYLIVFGGSILISVIHYLVVQFFIKKLKNPKKKKIKQIAKSTT